MAPVGLRHARFRAALLRADLAGGVRPGRPSRFGSTSTPHLRVDVDGLGVHAPHAKAVDGAGLPLVVLHGWPSSFVQMLPVVPLLTTGADPFDVVVISLPGYGFSDRPRQRGMDLTRIAEIVVKDLPRGGHFLEWEVPQLIADDLHSFFNSHR
jgi:pimeloyl-ACP methyl ester carboxylesterase